MVKVLVAVVLLSLPAYADYKCQGDRVEKAGSTRFTIRRGEGASLVVEKDGGTRGRLVQRGARLEVEVAGSTRALIEDGKILKDGGTWSTVADAQRRFDCDGNTAATLWVLFELGALR